MSFDEKRAAKRSLDVRAPSSYFHSAPPTIVNERKVGRFLSINEQVPIDVHLAQHRLHPIAMESNGALRDRLLILQQGAIASGHTEHSLYNSYTGRDIPEPDAQSRATGGSIAAPAADAPPFDSALAERLKAQQRASVLAGQLEIDYFPRRGGADKSLDRSLVINSLLLLARLVFLFKTAALRGGFIALAAAESVMLARKRYLEFGQLPTRGIVLAAFDERSALPQLQLANLQTVSDEQDANGDVLYRKLRELIDRKDADEAAIALASPTDLFDTQNVSMQSRREYENFLIDEFGPFMVRRVLLIATSNGPNENRPRLIEMLRGGDFSDAGMLARTSSASDSAFGETAIVVAQTELRAARFSSPISERDAAVAAQHIGALLSSTTVENRERNAAVAAQRINALLCSTPMENRDVLVQLCRLIEMLRGGDFSAAMLVRISSAMSVALSELRAARFSSPIREREAAVAAQRIGALLASTPVANRDVLVQLAGNAIVPFVLSFDFEYGVSDAKTFFENL